MEVMDMITAYTVMASRARLSTNSKCICQLSAAFYVQKKKKLTLLKLIDGVLAEKEEFGSIEKSTH